MIKIAKQGTIVEVPMGAYLGMYKKQGWAPVGEDGNAKPVVEPAKEPAKDAEASVGPTDEGSGEDKDNIKAETKEVTDEELILIPVSDMSKEQVYRAAALCNVDTEGLKTKEIRAKLRKVLGQ